jgi:23S rRNA (guanosine2251-2'-O)-methyltransferase
MYNNPKFTKQKYNDDKIWLFGKHAVKAALTNPNRKCYNLLATNNSIIELKGLYELHKSLKVTIVDAKIIDNKFSKNCVHQNIALEVSPIINTSLEDIINLPLDNSCIIALDQVTDPHNIGAIIRSAAAFNATCVIATINSSPSENATIAKTASGALEVIPLIKITNLVSTLKDLKASGYWIVGLDGKAELSLHQLKLDNKTVFVMGAESKGLRRLTKETCDFITKLPISEMVESLNVSNASTIALYEYFRQQ